MVINCSFYYYHCYQEHHRHRHIANPTFHHAWPTELFGNLAKDLFEIINKKKQFLEEFQNNNNNHQFKDLLTLMLEAERKGSDEKYKLTMEELTNDLKIFFLAGHDTTATALTAAIGYLAMYPEYQV